jgi:SAM-dependent methyltransferase
MLNRLKTLRGRIPHLIVDRERRLGLPGSPPPSYDVQVRKEALSRDLILGRTGENMMFLDVGGRDGELEYLLRNEGNFVQSSEEEYANHAAQFRSKYSYTGLDLVPGGDHVLAGDICSDSFSAEHPNDAGRFDIVYSNNVFEHLRRPWQAAANIVWLTKAGGMAITIAPFSLRYHESPADYFRFTHTGLASLFIDAAANAGRSATVVRAGYDVTGRRNDWQGTGAANDICPVDRFGAWRENWFVFAALEVS